MAFGCTYVNQIGQNCGQPAGHKFRHGNGLITRPSDTWYLPEEWIKLRGQEALVVQSNIEVPSNPEPFSYSERKRIYIEKVIDSAIENLARTKSVLSDLA